jgi:hypothetical protein
MGRERVLEESSISEDRLDAALAYHGSYHDEVDEKILENYRSLRYWRERYPDPSITPPPSGAKPAGDSTSRSAAPMAPR